MIKGDTRRACEEFRQQLIQSRSLVASVSVRSRQSLGEKPTGGVASIFCSR